MINPGKAAIIYHPGSGRGRSTALLAPSGSTWSLQVGRSAGKSRPSTKATPGKNSLPLSRAM